MSQETFEWLAQNVLVGFTDERGKAWHYLESLQGDEPNHYPGAIPVEDVKRRLFHWEAVPCKMRIVLPGGSTVTDPDRVAIARPDTKAVLGVFKEKSYKIHQFSDWLLGNVSQLLDDDLQIGSAGLLKGGAIAWVSVEVPESIKTPSGVQFRPRLLATTSHDGSLATTYGRCVTVVVCDNTMAAGLAETRGKDGLRFKVRHSANSLKKLQDAREALAIVHEMSEDFTREVEQLTNTTVTDDQFQKFLDEILPVPEDDGRSKTTALDKHATLTRMWESDERVSPWRGTAFGVLQATNTFSHHESGTRARIRPERNMLKTVYGYFDREDEQTLNALQVVLA